MTSLVFALYLADIAKNISFCSIAAVICGGAVSVFACAWFVFESENHEPTSVEYRAVNKIRKFALTVTCASILLAIFVPAKQVIYAYAGASAAEMVTDKVAADPRFEKVLKYVDLKLDEMIEGKKKK